PVKRFAYRHHDRQRFGVYASRDEAEDLGRGGVQPLRVLDEAEHRALLRDGRQQVEDGQPDEEPFWHLSVDEAKRGGQGLFLGCGKRLGAVGYGGTQLMYSRERQFHLGLDAGELHHAEAGRLACGVTQQRGLADARLAADDQRLALTRTYPRQKPIEQLTLGVPAHQPWSASGGHG